MPEPETVYVKSTLIAINPADGMAVKLTRGEAWDAQAAIVVQRPDLFSSDLTTVRTDGRVEKATRGPGERRR